MGDNQVSSTSTTNPTNPKITETINQLLGGVQDAWKTGPQVFGESLYGGVGDTTRQGWSSALTAARNPAFNSALSGSMNYTNRLIGNGGLTGRAPGGAPSYTGSAAPGRDSPMVPHVGPDGGSSHAGGMAPQSSLAPQSAGGAPGDSGGLLKNGYLGEPGTPTPPGQPGHSDPMILPVFNDPGYTPPTPSPDPWSGSDQTYGAGSVTADGGQWGDLQTTRGIGSQYGQLGSAFTAGSPGIDRLRSNLADDTLTGVNSIFGGSGRLGSGMHTEKASEGLGNALAAFDYGNYQNDINNRYRSLDSQAGQASTAFGMEQQGINNQMGLGASLPGQYASSLLPSQTYGMVGSAQDADRQANLLGRNDLFRRTNDSRTDLLAKLSSILSGTAGAGGSTTTNTEPSTPWWQTGISLLGQFL
jgi:hypothetical protein